MAKDVAGGKDCKLSLKNFWPKNFQTSSRASTRWNSVRQWAGRFSTELWSRWDRLRDLSKGVADLIAAHPDTRRVSFDWIEPARRVRIQIDQDQARRIGYTSEALRPYSTRQSAVPA